MFVHAKCGGGGGVPSRPQVFPEYEKAEAMELSRKGGLALGNLFELFFLKYMYIWVAGVPRV